MNFFKYKKYLKINLKLSLSLSLSLLMSCGALDPEGKEKSLKLMDKVDNLLETDEEVVKTYKRERTPLSEEVVEKQLEATAAAAAAEESKKAVEEAQVESDRKQQEVKAAKSATKEEAKAKAAVERRRRAQIEQYKKQEKERKIRNEQREKDRQVREEEQRQAEEKNKNRYQEKLKESIDKLNKIISEIQEFEGIIGSRKGSLTEEKGQDIEDKVTGPIYDSFTGNSGIFETWAEGFTYDDGGDIYDELEKARKELRKKIKKGQGDNEQTKTIVDVKDIQTELSKLKVELQKFHEYLKKPENNVRLKEAIDKCLYGSC